MTHIALPPAVRAALAFAAPLWLVACGQAPELQNDATPANMTGSLPRLPANLAIAPTDARVVEKREALTPEAAKGEKGARAVLLDWARALERGDWAGGRAQWGHGGEGSGLDADGFANAWSRYRRITVSLGDGAVEGGAGSLYYQVPVTVDAVLRDGRVAHMAGPVTLRRVNDVDGASAQELAWHIARSDLKPRP
ncbi:MAG: hypothetical protein QM690_18805 [Sphingobium sp.]